MVARILKLPADRMSRREGRLGVSSSRLAAHADRVHFWRGASGRSYPHIVFGLVECPPVPAANYVMVRRERAGQATVLRIGHVRHEADSLNLAELRQIGATLGASEIHLHFTSDGAVANALQVEFDLEAGCRDDAPATSYRAATSWQPRPAPSQLAASSCSMTMLPFV